MARSNSSTNELSVHTDASTWEISYQLWSGAILSVERMRKRIRSVLRTKSATNFTGCLAEDHIVELLRRNTRNTTIGIIDLLKGSIPDIFLMQEDDTYMLEVKTVAIWNQLVLKREQLERFENIKNCYYVFTEHNITGSRQALKKRWWHLAMSEMFRLTRAVVVKSDIITDICEEEARYGYTISSNGTYTNIRLNRLLKVSSEQWHEVYNQDNSKIFTISKAPDFFPDSHSHFFGSQTLDFAKFPRVDPRTL